MPKTHFTGVVLANTVVVEVNSYKKSFDESKKFIDSICKAIEQGAKGTKYLGILGVNISRREVNKLINPPKQKGMQFDMWPSEEGRGINCAFINSKGIRCETYFSSPPARISGDDYIKERFKNVRDKRQVDFIKRRYAEEIIHFRSQNAKLPSN